MGRTGNKKGKLSGDGKKSKALRPFWVSALRTIGATRLKARLASHAFDGDTQWYKVNKINVHAPFHPRGHDEPDFLEIFGRKLSAAGFKVDTAENGQVALDKIATAKPDLVLMDIGMPVMDGPRLLSRSHRYLLCTLDAKERPFVQVARAVLEAPDEAVPRDAA